MASFVSGFSPRITIVSVPWEGLTCPPRYVRQGKLAWESSAVVDLRPLWAVAMARPMARRGLPAAAAKGARDTINYRC